MTFFQRIQKLLNGPAVIEGSPLPIRECPVCGVHSTGVAPVSFRCTAVFPERLIELPRQPDGWYEILACQECRADLIRELWSWLKTARHPEDICPFCGDDLIQDHRTICIRGLGDLQNFLTYFYEGRDQDSRIGVCQSCRAPWMEIIEQWARGRCVPEGRLTRMLSRIRS